MKKILIITNGSLPVPAVEGGAVETLIDTFVRYNEKSPTFAIDVLSRYSQRAEKIAVRRKARYIYIKCPPQLVVYDKLRYLYTEYIKHDWRSMFVRMKSQQEFYSEQIASVCDLSSYDAVIVENNMSVLKDVHEAMGDDYGKKCIFHMHSILIDNTEMIPYLAKCRAILTVSGYVGDKLYETVPEFCDTELLTVRNGVDAVHTDQYKLRSFKKEFFRRYGIRPGTRIFLYSGRLSPEKGVMELISAFGRTENAVLVVMGAAFSGSNRKNSYVNKLYAEAKGKSIIFTGYVPHSKTAYYYKLCDAVVVPSVVEDAGPLTVLEGMAYRKFMILSEMGGIPEYTAGYPYKVYVKKDERFTERLGNAMREYIAFGSVPKVPDGHTSGGKNYFESFKTVLEKII